MMGLVRDAVRELILADEEVARIGRASASLLCEPLHVVGTEDVLHALQRRHGRILARGGRSGSGRFAARRQHPQHALLRRRRRLLLRRRPGADTLELHDTSVQLLVPCVAPQLPLGVALLLLSVVSLTGDFGLTAEGHHLGTLDTVQRSSQALRRPSHHRAASRARLYEHRC